MGQDAYLRQNRSTPRNIELGGVAHVAQEGVGVRGGRLRLRSEPRSPHRGQMWGDASLRSSPRVVADLCVDNVYVHE